MEFLKNIIKKSPFYRPLRDLLDLWGKLKWHMAGKPIPPPHLIKQLTLKKYARKLGLKVLIETGTYCGDMIYELKDKFDQIYSIELSDVLYENAKIRFKEYKHIKLIHGNSGIELEYLLQNIRQPVLFWLDSHYSYGETARGSSDTPLLEELDHILNAMDLGHIIIIDDARFFGTDPAYPSIDALNYLVSLKRPGTNIVIKNDMIRIIPNKYFFC